MNTKTAIMVLHEFAQKDGSTVIYNFISMEPGNFKCSAKIDYYGNREFMGHGHTKKEARQNAAQLILERLHSDGKFFPSGEVMMSLKPKSDENWENHYCKLQDFCTEYNLGMPEYELKNETGPPHAKQFTVECKVGQITRTAIAKTKKSAKQLSAGKVMEYFATNIPERITEAEEMEVEENKFQEAASKYSANIQHGDSTWKPNLGQIIADYPYAFKENLEPEQFAAIKSVLSGPSHDLADKLNKIVEILSAELVENILPAMSGSMVCLKIHRLTPPITMIGMGKDDDTAKSAAMVKIFDYLDLMMSIKR